MTPSTMRSVEPGASSDMFWQRETEPTHPQPSRADEIFDKQVWMQNTHLTWGICGYTAFVDNGDVDSNPVPAATVFFAPISYMPGARKLPTGPVSPDAILLSTVHVSDAYMGLYLEHQLIDTVLNEATRRGVKAVEAFARAEEFDDTVIQRAMGLTPGSPQSDQNDTANGKGHLLMGGEEGERSAAIHVASEDDANRRRALPLTPLQELQFIPEAYRGWDRQAAKASRGQGVGEEQRGQGVGEEQRGQSAGEKRRGESIGENQRGRYTEGRNSWDDQANEAALRGTAAGRSAPLGGTAGEGGAQADEVANEGEQVSTTAPVTADTTSPTPSLACGLPAAPIAALQEDPQEVQNVALEDALEWAPLLSEDILEAEGFSVVAHHPKYPRYRRELPEAMSVFARFEKAEHQELNGPEEIHTVLGGDNGRLSPMRSEVSGPSASTEDGQPQG
ncbi:hypothetical protein [Corynebacterium auriscanis]|uniref:hypothetical protein n=1 Tax=Corynebacterium auriscanis TaxID=99807 RepID=UPI0025B48718|nr:hypothetical protein [Corynebacterium auriscanis]